ncbi:TrbC/VirB2 family protein [Haloarchaeobius baliensis]|uniref:TrbC/VirB2 family protein n=1 Tax=Haloarchaeobius baliensis TaxID=1670458 RepID=UPI003F881C42
MNTLPVTKHLKKHRMTVLMGLITLTLFVQPVAAQTGTSGLEGIMTNLYDTVLLVLKYAGLVGLALGAIVWFTARKNSDRAENGMWLMIGGASMTIFYFGVTVFVTLLEWIATP